MSAAEAAGAPRRLASPAEVVAGLAGVYMAQSVIGGVTFQGLPAVLRQDGASLSEIGMLLVTVAPWSFKFLWSPWVESYRLPAGRPHRSRQVVLIGGVVVMAMMVGAGLAGPGALGLLMTLLTIAAFATATVDIACDGYAVETLSERHRGWGNAAQVAGAYAGTAIGGGLFLVLVDHFGWAFACFAMAAVLAALCALFVLGRDGPRPPRAADAARPNLRAALRRREVRYGLLLVAIYVVGQKWAMVLIGPYLVDAGLSLTLIGVINGLGGMGAGVLGALLGGGLVRRFGGGRVAIVSMGLQAAVTLGFAASAAYGLHGAWLVAALALLNAVVMAVGFVALYARLMGYASLDQAGVDFTLFQCADAIASVVGWLGASAFGDALGYAWCFGLTGAVAVAATFALAPAFRRADAAL